MLGGPLRAVARREARVPVGPVAERLRARRAAAAECDRAIGVDLEPVAVRVDDLGRPGHFVRPTYREASPIDAQGNVPVRGADGWHYKPFEHDEAHNLHVITLVREEDGEEVTFTMPDFVEQGDELGEIALLVIRARQRWRELKGLGG